MPDLSVWGMPDGRSRITIPLTPGRELNPNHRGHWSALAKARKVYRQAAYFATLGSLCGAEREYWFFQYMKPIRMDIEVAWEKGRKRMDDDNLIAALKSARDGIADALWNGHDQHIEVGSVRQTRGDGTVTLTLTAVEGAS